MVPGSPLTVRVMGPRLSNVLAVGTAPHRLMSPTVVLNPTTPLALLGPVMPPPSAVSVDAEPRVWVPTVRVACTEEETKGHICCVA